MNLQLFRAINGWPESWAPFLRFFSEAANQLWFKILALLLIVGMIAAGKRSRATIIQALIALGIANFFTDCFKNFLPEPRPFQEISDVIRRAGWAPSHGTASAHCANMAAVAFVFTLRQKWWGTPWIVAAVLTGFSRVYVGVHYPYQVALGWLCGVASGLLVTKTWDYVAKQRKTVKESVGETPTLAENEP